jgi:hypothetical protein
LREGSSGLVQAKDGPGGCALRDVYPFCRSAASSNMNKTIQEKEAVLNVFATLARPLMRIAFEYGISASEIAGVVRRVYIQALEARLQEQKRPTTDARLAAVAGLPRSDVSALRDALRAGAPHSLRAYVSLDQISALLTVWHTHANFSGAYGLALDLDLQTVEGSPRRSFAELVSIACPQVDMETMLDELVAAGSVEVVDGQTVRCLSRAYVPRGSDVTRIERVGRFLGVAAGNYVHNLLRTEDEPIYFERLVVADEVLSDSARDSFLAVAGEKGQELLAELDTFLTRLPPSEGNAIGKKYGVGIYFFEEPAANGPAARSVERTQTNVSSAKAAPMEEIDVLAPKRRKE